LVSTGLPYAYFAPRAAANIAAANPGPIDERNFEANNGDSETAAGNAAYPDIVNQKNILCTLKNGAYLPLTAINLNKN